MALVRPPSAFERHDASTSTSRALVRSTHPNAKIRATDGWELVLRSSNRRVVLYHRSRAAFVVQDEDEEAIAACPMCGQSLPRATAEASSTPDPSIRRRSLGDTAEYYGILESSSRAPSRPSTPPREPRGVSVDDDLSDALSDGYYGSSPPRAPPLRCSALLRGGPTARARAAWGRLPLPPRPTRRAIGSAGGQEDGRRSIGGLAPANAQRSAASSSAPARNHHRVST